MIDRRRFLASLGALAVSPALSQSGYPFALGVASGYPMPSSVVLWTRLVGASSQAVEVGWEVAADESMKEVIR